MRFNPFQPNSPVYRGMFVGRYKEIEGIEKILFQTKNGNPTNILLFGERGIGKSSLLLYAKMLASGNIGTNSSKNNFMTVRISLTEDTSLEDLAYKIQDGIEREFDIENTGIAYLKKLWKFAKKMDVSGAGFKVGIKDDNEKRNSSQTIDDIIYSISATVRALTTDAALNELGFAQKKDGLIILIDEADKASIELKLGSFLKNLSEVLVAEDTNKFLLILAGLPEVKDALRLSHESSLRLFEEYELKPLKHEEVKEVVKRGIEESNQKTADEKPLKVDPKAYKSIYAYSEGYPHFVQQIGSSMIAFNKDDVISELDVREGFFPPNGALERIGERFYHHLYATCSPEQKTILKIIAKQWNSWIKIEEIKKDYKGKNSTLSSCLKALKDKGVILKKTDSRGEYRLQWGSFAFWITFQKI